MARKQVKIKVISQVRVGEQLVRVKDLNEEQRERFAIGMLVTYNNELFRGVAEFYPPPGFEVKNENGYIRVTRVPITTETI